MAHANTGMLHQPAKPVPRMIPDTDSGNVLKRKDWIYGFMPLTSNL